MGISYACTLFLALGGIGDGLQYARWASSKKFGVVDFLKEATVESKTDTYYYHMRFWNSRTGEYNGFY